MPNTCSAPGCRSNYPGEPYTPIFKLPTKPQHIRGHWLRALHREGIDDLKNVFVCSKHFLPEDIITEMDMPQPDGSIEKISRRPILRDNATPCLLPNCPKYLSTIPQSAKPERLDRQKIETDLFFQAIEQSRDSHRAEENKFAVKSLAELKLKLTDFEFPPSWIKWFSEDNCINLIHLSKEKHVSIPGYITINDSLTPTGFYHNTQIPLSIDHLNDIRQINIIISDVTLFTKDFVERNISEATTNIESTVSKIENSNDLLEKYLDLLPSLKFLLCQLENILIPKSRRRYNVVAMVLALKAHLISSTCYNYIQSLNYIILPHPSTLRRLYGAIGLECELKTYLIASTEKFNSQERNVTLHLDEIHVKSEFSYTGGRILGSSANHTEAANTVLAFMISSLCKKWSTVVRLLPCAKSSAAQILPILYEVIKDVESCNLQIQVICTDNYPLNVNLFKLLSPTSSLETCVPHPLESSRPLHLIFDFVHIVKTVRNNWINQIDSNHTFICPSFTSFDHSFNAVFQDLRNLFMLEQNSVAKTPHRLTAKSCWPSSLERQNVNLALRIFDDSTVAALTVHASKYDQVSETAQFISLICKIWKIFNVGTPYKGIRLNDKWKSLPNKHGKLTAQTFTSFRHSCTVLEQIVNHLTKNCGFTYVLSSFLQNDPIEHHFGIYRMMSGAQYNVTVCQILQSERLIKISAILKLFSPNTPEGGSVSLQEFLHSFASSEESNDNVLFDLDPYTKIINEDETPITLDTSLLQSLAFIAGYCVHSIFKSALYCKRSSCTDSSTMSIDERKSSICSQCLSDLVEEDTFDVGVTDPVYGLIFSSDRGGLKWPSAPVLEAVVKLWTVYTRIEMDSTIFSSFLRSPSRKILVSLTLHIIERHETEFWRNKCPSCNTIGWNTLKKIILSATNCILANKIKNMNSLKRTLSDSLHNSRKYNKLKSK